MGLFEAATGLGFLFGPLIGSALYSIGGYTLPFYGLSLLYILFLPVIFQVARLVEQREAANEKKAKEEADLKESKNEDYEIVSDNS